jgi:hypothetical protein
LAPPVIGVACGRVANPAGERSAHIISTPVSRARDASFVDCGGKAPLSDDPPDLLKTVAFWLQK